MVTHNKKILIKTIMLNGETHKFVFKKKNTELDVCVEYSNNFGSFIINRVQAVILITVLQGMGGHNEENDQNKEIRNDTKP